MMKNIISVEQNRYQPFFLALNQRCTGGSGLLNAIFFTLRESRRTPDPALPKVRSSLYYDFTLGRLGSGALRLLHGWGEDYGNCRRLYTN